MKKIIVIILICLSLTGCFDYMEMNELSFVTALGIEKKEDDYFVTVQVANISKVNSETGADNATSLVINGSGKTILDAVRNLSKQTPKTLFFSHAKLILLDDSVIKEDLIKVLDILLKDKEISINKLVVTTIESTPSEILKVLSPIESFTINDIVDTVKNSNKLSGIGEILTIGDTFDRYKSYGIENIFTNIELTTKNDDEASNVEVLKKTNPSSFTYVNNMAFVNNENDVIVLDTDESLGYNILKSNIENPSITLKCDNDYFTAEINEGKTKIKFDKKKNQFNIDSKFVISMHDFSCNMNLHDKNTLKFIENTFNDAIKNYINKTIDSVKNNNTDFIGFGEVLYKQYPKLFDFKNKDWNLELDNYKYKVNVKTNIIKQGNLYGGANDKNEIK